MNFKFRFDLFFQSRGGGGRKKRGGGKRAAQRKASTPRALHPPPSFYISFLVARDVVGTAAREFLPSSLVMISKLSFFSLSFFPPPARRKSGKKKNPSRSHFKNIEKESNQDIREKGAKIGRIGKSGLRRR